MRETECEVVFAPRVRMGAVDFARLIAKSSVRSPELRSICWTGLPGTTTWAAEAEPVNRAKEGKASVERGRTSDSETGTELI